MVINAVFTLLFEPIAHISKYCLFAVTSQLFIKGTFSRRLYVISHVVPDALKDKNVGIPLHMYSTNVDIVLATR